MASRVVDLVGFVLIAAAAGANASTYYVGDELGWRVPPLGDIAYKTWGAEKSFSFGDTVGELGTCGFLLEIVHCYVQLDGDSHRRQGVEDGLRQLHEHEPHRDDPDGDPYSVTLSTNSSRYFICTISNHCRLGQKVTLGIGSASSLAVHSLSFALSALAFAFLNHS
ncbi:uncharacterized protein J3R85_008903 [Psidium guajava]|nr:uncharacterized protein J3R85_008903 [Psidium guajava]